MDSESRIRPMRTDDLSLVLHWRNHPDIRSYMYSQHEIDETEHRNWFERTSDDPSKHILIFESNNQPAGFVQFRHLLQDRVAEWGFYADPNAPKGTGRELGKSALNYAFVHINLHKVCGQALAFNERSIKFHDAMGFRIEGTLRDQHFDGNYYHDVICFGLLKADWLMHSRGQ
jgi:UDP-4-amino-4,6-dideoxy-N-acetyl-beta-L-altrosamine N-acetyltransferase